MATSELEQPGFGSGPPTERDFAVVKRGFDPDQVRRHLRHLADRIGALQGEIGRLRSDLDRERARGELLERKDATSHEAAYARAMRQLTDVVRAADRTAVKLKADAEEEARATVAGAGAEAERIAADARDQVATVMAEARAESQRIVAEGRRQADRILAEARAEVARRPEREAVTPSPDSPLASPDEHGDIEDLASALAASFAEDDRKATGNGAGTHGPGEPESLFMSEQSDTDLLFAPDLIPPLEDPLQGWPDVWASPSDRSPDSPPRPPAGAIEGFDLDVDIGEVRFDPSLFDLFEEQDPDR